MANNRRIVTNKLFKQVINQLTGADVVELPAADDDVAVSCEDFKAGMDTLMDNPPWSGGGSGGEDQFLVINFSMSGSNDNVTVSCDTFCEDILASTKPIMAYFDTGESVMQLTRIDSLQFVYNMVLEQGIMQMVISGDYAQGLPDSWEMNSGLIPFSGGGSDGPIVYNAIVTTNDAQTFTVSEFKDLEDNNVTLSAVLTALGITIDDGRYVRPVDLKDIVVNVSVDGTGAVAQFVNAIGKLHFTAADGISQTVNFSGAVSIAAPNGEGGFVSTSVLMNLRVGDNSGTPVYTFEQEDI